MILPIYAYGQPVLKKVAAPITTDYPELSTLIANMWETMEHADGVGLAAPQIGLSIRLFVADTTLLKKEKDSEETKGFRKVFINAQMLDEKGEVKPFEEGCLSIPHIRGDVERKSIIHLRWQDEQFETHEATFEGVDARVIQHEYDHIQGILFTEHLKPLRRRMIQRRLDTIRDGKVSADYKMRFFSGR
jgi:peptide deformylase